MFEVYWGNVNLAVLTLIISVVFVLPAQLLLCFKAKRLTVRLLPVIILSGLIIAFIVMNFAAIGWDRLLYVFFAVYTAFMLFMCCIGWGIWAIARKKE